MQFRSQLYAVLFIGASVSAQSSFPTTIPVQGRLTLTNGTAVHGVRQMTFRIYAAASAGTRLWSEVQGVVAVN